MPDRAHLEHHDAQRVRHDVVELARDAGALLRHREPGSGLALALRLRGSLLGLGRLDVPLPESEPAEPPEREHRRDEDDVPGRVIREVVDDDRRAPDHDQEPLAAPVGIREAAEQVGRREAGEVDGDREGDEPAVHEREPRREQPERRGRAEREPASR